MMMGHIWWRAGLALAGIALAAGACWAAEAEIVSVDVYPSGARFVFAVASAQEGFDVELPGAFDASSVRLLEPREALGLRVERGERPGWTPPALTELKGRIEAKERDVALIEARKASLEQTHALLGALRPKEADAASLLAYIQEAQAMELRAASELVDVEIELREGEEELRAMREELSSRMPVDAGSFVRVSGRARSDGPLHIEASTSAARWWPRYTMDLDTATGKIETRMRARAVQRTGLDWTGPLTFHTKLPDETVTAPELRPLRVSLKPKPAPATKAARRADRAMAEEDAAPMAMMRNAVFGMGQAPMEAATADLGDVMESTLADRAVRGTGTLAGDGKETDIVLGDVALTGTTQLIVIPEQRSDAWIVVSMDAIATPLIPGTAELRVDGRPAGTTHLPEYGLGQTRIPFGYAPQIAAKKEPLVGKTGTSWFSGTSTDGYALEVTNGMKEPRKIIVRDRLPIPTDEKIELKVDRIEPAPKERDARELLTWELELAPGETGRIVVEHTLSYPSGEELQYR
ncbi:MAG: mucoidy inhibitor MuiA family protein [Synergistaceae bacterium]|nr:mucoidy inhibitor MuiA family protein [Synergistaceae bacterium]